jgi:hypothetical protein
VKINKPLRIGLLLLLVFIIIETVGNLFFAIRDKGFYSFVIYFELFAFLSIAAILIFGLYKLQNDWKWFFILPLALFGIIYFFGTFYFPFPNEITVKEDTEVLYVNSSNNNKKIVRQAYWTGVTGSSYHSDTLVVNDFCPWLRLVRPAQTSKIDNAWICVSKHE